ncbi:MAG: hypothetical protein NTW67_06315 [Candidatus Woesearchaeota archaeon]|nr:hypothetical protein [Candidatus Woesearchaeota archaeon]
MDPIYEGTISWKRLYVPPQLDDIMFALRLEGDCVATFLKEPVRVLALRHVDVFKAECEQLKDSIEGDVFGEKYLCADTEQVKRRGKHFLFRERSLEDLSVANKSPVCLDVIGENLIIVKKEDWQKYVAGRLIDSK